MDQNEAARILGISNEANKEEIRKKYFILSKRYEMEQRQKESDGSEGTGEGADEGVDIKKVIEAYNFLMGYDKLTPEEEAMRRRPPNPIYKKLGLDEGKVKNFFYYYKSRLLIGAIAVIVLFSMIRGCILRVDPDINLSLIGNLYIAEEEIAKLEQKIKDEFADIKEINVENLYSTGGIASEQDIAIQQKVMLVLTVGDTDIIILDKVNYERYAAQGAFLSLDQYSDSWGVDKEKNKDNIVKLADSEERHLYGINIVDAPFLKDIQLLGKEKIAAIKFNAKNMDNALKVFEFIIK